MDRIVVARALFAGLLATCAVVLSIWGAIPLVGITALGLLGCCIVGLALKQENHEGPPGSRVLAFAWVCTLVVPTSVLLSKQIYTLDTFYALLAWLIAAAFCAVCFGNRHMHPTKHWEALGLTWAAAGVFPARMHEGCRGAE